ncbi:hypothetical protein LPJ78_005701 [Coemansia sp. RSA 989]|nr:hypothetical protein BX667DRAFT_513818 [Coemansia mojavensis]KAJ1746743.1 hypothetical protein LPJ79_005714 [Coemansia sp. RSA 1821]KAJ1860757.1 hypothetical protein LPJ78_005701 [Coemansia sp. RSA 989]KAJ1868899.1 hypothetical protein LPJ55_005711 [Coemansia sp. RSA 990]
MVSYTDLSPLKQPEAPVVVHLNDPPPAQASPTHKQKGDREAKGARRDSKPSQQQSAEAWLRNWNQLHSKVLYFKGVTEDALTELRQLFKQCRGIRLNVEPHESRQITGNVEFRNVFDTEKAMALLNNYKLKENNGTLIVSPLSTTEIGPPPAGGHVLIKHIPEDASAAALYDFMRPSGTLYSCRILTYANGQQKDSAQVCFVDIACAHAAVEQLNFAEFQGNNISVRVIRPRANTATSTASARSDHSEASLPVSAEAAPRPAPVEAPPPTHFSPQLSSPQGSTTPRRTASPNGPSESPGTGLGGVIVPGKLFVTNLHPTVSHKELFALFKKYGYIQSARVSIDPATQVSRGHGIVQFSDPNAVLEAMRECHGADIKGRKITLYQYEHVNKHNGSSNVSLRSNSPNKADKSDIAKPDIAKPAANQYYADPLLDPAMLSNLSESSRNEILMQKLLSEITSNSMISLYDASKVADCFIKRPLEDVLALLSDPTLLASEWNLEQQALTHLQYQHQSSLRSPVSQHSSPGAYAVDIGNSVDLVTAHMQDTAISSAYDDESAGSKRRDAGIRVPDYDTETEEFIELLVSKPESERKKKLGSKLFPLIKGMGYKESTKLTVWILDHMSHDVRTLAYTLNSTAKLREIVAEAQAAIGTFK